MTLKTPPGPGGDFFLGSTLDFKAHPAKYIRYVAQTYGDVTRFRVGPSYWYLVTHPEDIHDMMTKRGHIFLKPAIAKRLWEKFLGDGLLTTEGEVWERQSRLVRPAFRRSRIHAYGADMVEFTHRLVDRWEAGARVDMADAMTGLTLEIVAKTLFDADVHYGTSTVAKAMHVLQKEMLEHIYMPLPVPRWWPSGSNKRKLKSIEDIEQIVRDVIDERRASGEDRGDLLSMLLQPDESGDRLSDTEIRDQAMTIFFAGHETTANAMAWAWMLLAQHPEVTSRLQADIDRVTGGERVEVPHLQDLPYLDWTVKECLRLRPSVWVFIKQATEDVAIRGFKVPKGVPILISPYVTQLDERWFPSPQTFIPERFSPERVKQIPRGAYVPFSGGKRVCLGQGFAMMEMKLILASMLQRLQPTLAEGYVPKHKAELSMHPDGGLPIDVIFRDQAPDLRGAIGRSYTMEPVVVDAESMAAYALATNDPNPRYVDGDREGGTVAPPLYPVRIFHPLILSCVTDPLLDLDLLRVVHGEEDLTWHGPLRPGDVVERRAVLESISQKGSGVVASWRMFAEVDGEVHVEVVNSVFARGAKLPGMEAGDTYGSVPARRPAPEGEPAVTGAPMPVDPDQADRYAVASLDDNPIHVNPAMAKEAGLPGVILHGLCTMAFASRAVVDGLLDGDSGRLRRLSVRFTRPVLPGQILTTTVHDAGALPNGHRGYHLQVSNEAGEVVAGSGWAEIS